MIGQPPEVVTAASQLRQSLHQSAIRNLNETVPTELGCLSSLHAQNGRAATTPTATWNSYCRECTALAMRAAKVLIVDDEELDRVQIAQLLKAHGWDVVVADNYDQALTLFDLHGKALQLLIADVALPERNGCELAENARNSVESRDSGVTHSTMPFSVWQPPAYSD